jgi:hypothetical protein
MSEEQTQSAVERIKEEKRNAVEPEPFLKEAGAVRDTDTEQKLAFTESFADRLAGHIEQVQTEDIEVPDIAQLFGAPESEVIEKDYDYSAWRVYNTVYNWPSEGALVFDVATDRALREVEPAWEDVPTNQRFMIAQSLRSFQDYCLFCDGAMDIDNTPVRSCCSDNQVITLSCTECDRRFLEFRMEENQGVDTRS